MCGRKRKASELVKNWQGMYRCPVHNEVRHPQDFVRAVPDVQTPPWVQPLPTIYGDFPEALVTETYDTTSNDPFGQTLLYELMTESGSPITTE